MHYERLVIYDGKYAGRQLGLEIEVELRGTLTEIRLARKAVESAVYEYFVSNRGKKFTFHTGTVEKGKTRKKAGYSGPDVQGHRGALSTQIEKELDDFYFIARKKKKKRRKKN